MRETAHYIAETTNNSSVNWSEVNLNPNSIDGSVSQDTDSTVAFTFYSVSLK